MAGNGARNGRLIWIDLEMTGLDTDRDSIIEIATVVTDSELNILADGPELAISHPLSTLAAMDDWNRTQHGKSGLWRQIGSASCRERVCQYVSISVVALSLKTNSDSKQRQY